MTATSAHPQRGQATEALVADLVAALPGAVDDSRLSRSIYSTDASNYRVTPEVIVTPRTRDQVVTAVRIAIGHGVAVTARGGGTSCAGNAVGPVW